MSTEQPESLYHTLKSPARSAISITLPTSLKNANRSIIALEIQPAKRQMKARLVKFGEIEVEGVICGLSCMCEH